MTRVPDIFRKRVNWSLDLKTTRLVATYTAKHGGEERFNADYLIQRGAEAVGHHLSPDDFRAIADEIEENRARREAVRNARKKGLLK